MEGKELTPEETRFEHWFNTESSWKGSDALYLSEGRLARDAFMEGLQESQSLVSELTRERDGLREALDQAQRSLRNVLFLARRTNHSVEDYEHFIRFCEEAGIKRNYLRECPIEGGGWEYTDDRPLIELDEAEGPPNELLSKRREGRSE